jgi:hypothetical protein
MRIDLEPIEAALCDARTRLDQGTSANDLEAQQALRAARDYLELHRETTPEEYDLHAVLRNALITFSSVESGYDDAALRCRGDREQIGAAVRAAVQSAVLDPDAALRLSIAFDADVPIVRLELDGPGKINDAWLMGGHVRITWDELEPCWTRATRGGRIDRRPGAIDLRLSGIRVIPECTPPPKEVIEAVRTAERSIRVVTGEASQNPAVERKTATEALNDVLRLIDSADGRGPVPADVAVLLTEVVQSHTHELDRRAIACECDTSSEAPPIVVHRSRIRSAFANLLTHATESLSRGGTVAIMFEYSVPLRHVEVLMDISGTQYDRSSGRLLASVRRAVEESHAGRLDVSYHDSGMTATIIIPDPVGRDLDEWIPGFENFSNRSRQMLRLLMSRGPTPPEAFLLGGVLEEELERLLLPRLSVAPATNLAHDLRAVSTGLTGSSTERLEKALGQIRKGKSKKEICKPPYAGEIFWAFRTDARHRAAVGIGALDDASIQALCTELLKSPPGFIACLRMLARCCAKIGE